MVTTVAAAGRFRIGRPSMNGMRLVTDRVLSESWWIYPTMTELHERHGHERGRWYFRRLGDYGNSPVSIGYPSFEAALEALRSTRQFKDSTHDQAS